LTGGPPPIGDIGVCGTPTKDVEVGVNIMCRPWGTNIGPIISCAIEVGSDVWDCIQCILYEDPISCIDCAMSLIEGDYDCIDPDLCVYVEKCDYCLQWEEGCTVPIVETVVDWGKAQICYHMH
jgi:hypothetical protein